jgi:hypothetical protein
MSRAQLRQQRTTWLWAARDARLHPHAELAPLYLARARALHRDLLQLSRRQGAPPSSFTFASLEVSP